MKNLPKILISTFLIIFIFQMIGFIVLLVTPNLSQAVEFKPQVAVPEYTETTITENSIGKYIKAIYKWAIGIVGIVAAVVLMIGGVMWIVAGGNQGRIGEAKAWIGASLTGLIIALTSYMILYTVNPDLVQFKPIIVKEVKYSGTNCCVAGPGKCSHVLNSSQCTTGKYHNIACSYVNTCLVGGECGNNNLGSCFSGGVFCFTGFSHLMGGEDCEGISKTCCVAYSQAGELCGKIQGGLDVKGTCQTTCSTSEISNPGGHFPKCASGLKCCYN